MERKESREEFPEDRKVACRTLKAKITISPWSEADLVYTDESPGLLPMGRIQISSSPVYQLCDLR